jgi:acetyl esterase
MPLHPQAEVLVKLLDESGVGFYPDSTPESMRAAMGAVVANGLAGEPAVHSVEHRTVPGPAGDLPLRVYRPGADPSLPLLVWFHGGGWVTGSLETHDHLCRQLCNEAGAIVVSVDYRLAPETKFPGAVDDCVAAWTWVTEHAAELGADPARIALGGDSAGGNLAAVVALVARRDGLQSPSFQLLIYPVTDHEFASESMVENAKGYFLEAEEMRWFFDHYASAPADFADWRMSPLRATDLAGSPPALVITAEFDPLRDQGEAYGTRLQQAGVFTRVVRADGLFHGFFGMHAFLPPARPAWDTAIGALRASFGML